MRMFDPPHPGEIIRVAMGDAISVTALARHLGVTRSHLSMILNGRSGISPLMSIKLDEAFNKSDGFWSRLQYTYDLAQAHKIKRPRIEPIFSAAPLDHAA